MRAFFQIIKLELLAALRSKTMLIFAVAVSLWMTLGRNILNAGESNMYQLSVRYLLGVVFSVVLVSLGSAAAGALSSDRAAKRLQLSMIRPVPHFIIAMARSVAITMYGSLIIAFSLVLLWAFEGRGRMCDRVFSPVFEDARQVAQRGYDSLYETNARFKEWADKNGREFCLKYLEDDILNEYATVEPGKSMSWEIENVPDDAKDFGVRVRFIDFFGRPGSVAGGFSFRGFSGSVENPVRSLFYVPLNARSSGNSNASTLEFRNNTDIPLSLQPRKELHLLARSDSFAWNAFRAWIVMTAVFLIVVSAGMFFGACLGRGVAVFSVVSLLVVMVVGPATVEDSPDPMTLNTVSRLGLKASEFSAWVTSPVSRFSPVLLLESEERVGWDEIGDAAMAGVFYLVLFSLLSGFTMSRKHGD
ncbi:MAG: hypothetical protein J6W10_01675 [Kiritimatiellae bacterium]|nr:hypothetical protein [Kiritimatiellia bacterium]